MTQEKVKELLPIIQAFAEGKTVQYRTNNIYDWANTNSPSFNPDLWEYRIKPESEYHPFKNKEECWKEMLNHEPFGWIEDKEADEYFHIGCIASGDKAIDLYARLFKRCVFIDGTPFGIKEE